MINKLVRIAKDTNLFLKKFIKKQKRTEWKLGREVSRPWGSYDSLDNGSKHQVKRIEVKPFQKLSVQSHKKREEHWIVVSGTARVTNNGKTYDLNENESTFIPLGSIHALENPIKEKLVLIEHGINSSVKQLSKPYSYVLVEGDHTIQMYRLV